MHNVLRAPAPLPRAPRSAIHSPAQTEEKACRTFCLSILVKNIIESFEILQSLINTLIHILTIIALWKVNPLKTTEQHNTVDPQTPLQTSERKSFKTHMVSKIQMCHFTDTLSCLTILDLSVYSMRNDIVCDTEIRFKRGQHIFCFRQ